MNDACLDALLSASERNLTPQRAESVIPLQVVKDNSRPGVKFHCDTWFSDLKVGSSPRISSLRKDGEKVHC